VNTSLSRSIVTVLAIWLLGFTQVDAQDVQFPYRIVGYYTYYSIYDEHYLVTDIPADLITHLNYAYIDISENLQCVSADSWADTGFVYPGDQASERVRGNFKQLHLLREAHPNLQILMVIGGWEHSSNFSDAVLTPESRARFVRSCISYMRNNGFDGIDIDWRFPVVGGDDPSRTRPEDGENFTLLIQEFRDQLEGWSEEDGRRYLLTITAPAAETLYSHLQLDQIHGNLDWINLMAFGFYGSWSSEANHHAALYRNERDSNADAALTVSGAVEAYLNVGVPADKIVVGVPFFAQTWRNVLPNDYFGLFQPVDGIPTGTRSGGILYYQDLSSFLNSPSYIRFFDDEAEAAWMYNSDRRIAISYENEESIAHKAVYVRSLGLGGLAVWELAYDDTDHRLLNRVYSALHDLSQ
jgi:chitinase